MNARHFSVDEFHCHDGTDYPAEWVDDRLASLCGVLDLIREAWGAPIVVVCGYRTAAYNARLAAKSSGVALNSQHVQGRAADVAPLDPSRARVAELHALVKKLHREGVLPRLGGLGIYPHWIHVDVRGHRDGQLAEWVGAGVGSEQ
jgi:uncharacterized protein YcbK (DUF882 family)